MTVKKSVLLVISSDLVNAGVPNVVMTLVRNLSERYVFDIITYHNQEGCYDSEFESYGGKIYKISLLDYEKHKVLYPFRYVQIVRFLKKLFKQKKYDVIHCHNGIESGVFLKCSKKYGIPFRIAHAHGTYYRKGNNKLLLWYNYQCKKYIQQYATTALACSTQAGKSLFLSGLFINVLNPVDVYSYSKKIRNEHEGCNLLQIGYFCENKNQVFSLKLLKSLLDENMNVKLTFIGYSQDEEYYAKMLERVDKLGMKEKVVFLPPDSDKAQVFSDTDIVLLPSFTEGLPIVALESQSAHVAVLISDHVPSDADLGLATYVEYNNLEEWKKAVKQVYSKISCFDEIIIDTNKIEVNSWCNRIGDIYNGK